MKPKSKKAGMCMVTASIGVICLTFNAFSTTQPQQTDTTVSITSEKEMLIQELQRLNEMLTKATTEEEKKAITEKIQYTKNRLAAITGSTGAQASPDSAYRSEREMLIAQIEQLNKSLSVATSETEKNALIDKITSLKQRLAQLDSGNVYRPPVATSEKEMLMQELQRLNEMLAKATTEEEKKAITEKIQYTKNRLAVITGSTGTQTPPDSTYRSEREMLIAQIEQLNKSLSVATSETEKNALIDKITSLKQRLVQLDSGNVYRPPVATSEKEMLMQELQRLNEMLAKATTDAEKKALVEKIEYTKNRLATIIGSNGTQVPADSAYRSEREQLIAQIEQLNKSLAVVTSETEKKALIDKITYLKQRLTQLDSGNVYRPPVAATSEKEMLLEQIANLEKALSVAKTEEDKKIFTEKITMLKQRLAQLEAGADKPHVFLDSIGFQKIISEIKALDTLLIQKKIELTTAIQNNQKEEAGQLEQEITSLLEKKKMLESQLTTTSENRSDSPFNKDSLISHDARLSELKQKYESQKLQLDSVMVLITELKLKIEEAEKQGLTSEIQPMKNQLASLNEKAENLIVSIEKIRIEAEKIKAELSFKSAVSELKVSAGEIKTESDSLLKILKEKNKARLSLINSNADPRDIAAITDEILALKTAYVESQQKLDMVKTEINTARAENLMTQKTLQVEKVALVASENRNERGFYEVIMKQPENDTTKKINIQVKLNVLEQVNGEVEITEEIIDENPKGMKGLYAFDITPSVDLLMNLEDALIELPFNTEDIQGIDVQKLAIYHMNAQKGWEPVQGCSVDVARKVVFAKVTHFSVYGIFAEQSVSTLANKLNKPMHTSITTHNSNSTIVFKFAIPAKSFVQLYVYSINGRLVAKPIAGMYNEGFYSFMWDGKNSFRTSASTGKYIARLVTKDSQISKPFTLIK
jgi:phage terminase large subunit-like protein